MITHGKHASDHCPGLERVRERIYRSFVHTQVGRRCNAVRSGGGPVFCSLFRWA